MMPMARGCPKDPAEVAEQYCMGTLPEEAARAFEEHYVACPRCAARVDDTQQFVDAMRNAAKRIRGGDAPSKD
jgi:anti-sigma factor RsiW